MLSRSANLKEKEQMSFSWLVVKDHFLSTTQALLSYSNNKF